jgi:AcrR family transcriptional regulator
VPRAGLNPRAVVAEAARVADDVGWDRLTLAAVAQRLSVALPSLYKHVAGLDALQTGVAVQAVEELGAALTRATIGRSGGAALRAMAAAYRRYAHAHPGRYAAIQRASQPDQPELRAAGEAVLQVVFAVLAGYGLSGGDAVDAARFLRSALHGFVSLEAAGGFGMPHDVDRSFARLVDAVEIALQRWPAGL